MRANGLLLVGLLLASITPAEAQYRERARIREPRLVVALSPGVLWNAAETVRSRQPLPGQTSRLTVDRPVAPGLGLSVRWGRSLQVYAGASAFLGGEADITGEDPTSGAPVDSVADAATSYMASAGVSFVPAAPVRAEIGVGQLWLGDGGDYLGFRAALAADLWNIGDQFSLGVGGELWAAGGTHSDDDLERQLADGWLAAFTVRLEALLAGRRR